MGKKLHVISLIALSIAMFMSMLDGTIINIALPDITKYFNANLTDTSWISTIYVMGLSIFMVTASKLADQFGRKKIMLIGLALFGVSSALCGVSDSLLSLIVMRFIQGIGGAIITPLVIPMALESFPREKSQTVAGIIGAVTAAAAASGPPIGGLIVQYMNWQFIFFVNVPFAILSFILIACFMKETYDETTSKKIDWAGMLLLSSTLFLLTFAVLKGNDYGWNSALIIAMFIGSAISLALFLLVEIKSKHPMIDFSLFREKTFTASTICYAITGFSIASTMLIFSYFLQNALGYAVLDAAFIIMTLALTVMVSMPLGSWLAGKFGAKPVNFIGLIGMAIGIFLLSRLQIPTDRPILITDMAVCGFGLGFASQALVSAIKHLPKEKGGMGSGIANAARQVGVCIGIALLVSVLTTNATTAKDDIKASAITAINNSPTIVSSVKTVMIADINSSFTKSVGNSVDVEKNLESDMTSDVKNALSNVTDPPKPTDNDALKQLYEGAIDLKDGAAKAADGQNSLGGGISSLDSGLAKLQDGGRSLTSGSESLDDGLAQAYTGSVKLAEGANSITSLKNGIASLSDGAQSLASGTGTLLAQFAGGTTSSPTLRDSVYSLHSGAASLYAGTQALLAQFEDGSAASPTLKYNINSLNTGAQSLKSQVASGSTSNLKYLADSLNSSAGIPGYVASSGAMIASLRNASNPAIFNAIVSQLAGTSDPAMKQALASTLVLITNTADSSPDATLLVGGIPTSMTQTQATIALLGSAGNSSPAAIQQAQISYDNGGLSIKSSIALLDSQFSAGSDPSKPTLYDGINAISAGTKQLCDQMKAGGDPSNPTLYDSILLLNAGAKQLSEGTSALAAQMATSGSTTSPSLYDSIKALTDGAAQVSSGAQVLEAGSDQLNQLQTGIDDLSVAISKLKDGSAQLRSGSQDLQTGINSAKSGSTDLSGGSAQLLDALEKIKDGAAQIASGVGMDGQAQAIQTVIDNIKSNKDSKTATAFDNTFLLAAIIIAALAFVGLFTDKKEETDETAPKRRKIG
ncbi:MAG: DHA2 family efflux MFS transporter permease subunit [Eubacteriales bacterium]